MKIRNKHFQQADEYFEEIKGCFELDGFFQE